MLSGIDTKRYQGVPQHWDQANKHALGVILSVCGVQRQPTGPGERLV